MQDRFFLTPNFGFLEYFFIYASYGRNLFSRCVQLSLGDLVDTLNMFVKSTEIFIEAFENIFSSKHEVLSEYSNTLFIQDSHQGNMEKVMIESP